MKDNMVVRTVVETHLWTDKKVTGWVEANFAGDAREIAYTTLLWVADTWPGMRKKLGIKTTKTEHIGG